MGVGSGRGRLGIDCGEVPTEEGGTFMVAFTVAVGSGRGRDDLDGTSGAGLLSASSSGTSSTDACLVTSGCDRYCACCWRRYSRSSPVQETLLSCGEAGRGLLL